MKPTRSFYIHVTFLTIVALSMIGLVALPAVVSLTAVSQKIAQQDQKLSQKKSSGIDLEKDSADLLSAQVRAERLKTIFIEPNKELDLITSIESLAVKRKVSVLVVPQLTDKPTGAGVQKISMKISAGGEYLSIIKFISDLESLEHYFTVNRLTISVPKNSDGKNVSLEIEGQNYLDNIKK